MKTYFKIEEHDKKDLGGERLEIKAGKNGRIIIRKSDMGFIVDIWKEPKDEKGKIEQEIVHTAPIWEDDLEA